MPLRGTLRIKGVRTQLYMLINEDWLDLHVHVQMPSGQRLQDLDGLQKTLEGLCKRGVNGVFLRKTL